MPETYLLTAFKDRERVKSLGARWDPDSRRWYVPEGRDLAPFMQWLPAQQQRQLEALADAEPTATALALPTKGIGLSELLSGVANAVAKVYPKGEWVRAEVVKADIRRGHVYLELTERSVGGDVLAQARAVIWASTANQVVPAFEKATGVVLGAGIKLLLKVRPNFSAQYGLSLVIEAIDPDYTLGDLEAKKREIRARLHREGLIDLNRGLAPPWDYNAVLVIAPQGGAGLGDFMAEAERLQRWGLCRFIVVHSRFQGEGAATEVRQALLQGVDAWAGLGLDQDQPDAVVLIRGGGAVNDLAWLDDYELARAICELPIPVLVGIGHERDRTVLDEVAHTSYDTPSKVIAGIEQAITRRAREARSHHELIVRSCEQALHRSRLVVEQGLAGVRESAQLVVRNARERSMQAFQGVRHDSLLGIEQARHAVPATMAEVASLARQTGQEARQGALQRLTGVLERAGERVSTARQHLRWGLQQVEDAARRQVLDARVGAQATMREIAGQGPEKTLARGFAVARAPDGSTVTSAEAAASARELQIEFRDGRVPVRVMKGGDAQ